MTNKRAQYPLVGSFNRDVIHKINSEDTFNLYEVVDPNIVSGSYLAYWPGKALFEEFIDGGSIRASIVHKDEAFFVVGESVYRLDASLTLSVIGSGFFSGTANYVGAAANENQIAFVDNQQIFLWDRPTSSVLPVTLPSSPSVTPLDITFMDGYLIILSGDPDTPDRFYISALNDGTTWDPLNFALVNSRPTINSCCEVLKRRLFLFGETVGEVWQDAGESDFPFRRVNSLLMEHGVKAKATLVEGFDRLFYLSNDKNGVGSVMIVEGTYPQPISTREVDEFIQGLESPEDADGFVFKINGLIFYQLNFTTANKSIVYNVDMKKWHRIGDLQEGRDWASHHVYFQGRHLAGRFDTNNLYEIRNDYLSNEGERMPRYRVGKPFKSPRLNRIRINRLLLELLQGTGISYGNLHPPILSNPEEPEYDPKIHLWISEDGGASFKNMLTADIGKSGERLTRTFWNMLGTYREFIPKVEIVSNTPFYMISAVLDYEELEN